MDELEAYKRRAQREKEVRIEAERLLDQKAEELYHINNKLNQKSKDLELTLSELEDKKSEQLSQAYAAGIAENSISVLHNVGNALTPAFIKIESLIEEQEGSRVGYYLEQINSLINEHLKKGDLVPFLNSDDKGKELLPFMADLSKATDEDGRGTIDDLKSILNELQHVKEIIDLQKKYSSFKSPKVMFSFSTLLEDVLEMMNPSFTKRNILLLKDIATEIPKVRNDRNKVVQVLLNLLKNAVESIDEKIKSSKELTPEISVSLKLIEKNQLICLIEDNGIGLPISQKEAIFKMGYTSKKKGSGIGLHDCSNFIRSQGGNLSIESKGTGHGAIVKFSLPISTE